MYVMVDKNKLETKELLAILKKHLKKWTFFVITVSLKTLLVLLGCLKQLLS